MGGSMTFERKFIVSMWVLITVAFWHQGGVEWSHCGLLWNSRLIHSATR